MSAQETTTDGVRLLSHRPSVLFKVAHHATEPVDGDISVDGIVISGPGWGDRLRDLMARSPTPSARACSPCALRRARPAAAGQDAARPRPHRLVPQVPLAGRDGAGLPADRRPRRRRGLRPRGADPRPLGRVELRGGELLEAAEAHDALFSFDSRARAAALEAGLPLLPAGELLFVKLDPRAVIDVECSLRSVWPLVERAGGRPSRSGSS